MQRSHSLRTNFLLGRWRGGSIAGFPRHARGDDQTVSGKNKSSRTTAWGRSLSPPLSSSAAAAAAKYHTFPPSRRPPKRSSRAKYARRRFRHGGVTDRPFGDSRHFPPGMTIARAARFLRSGAVSSEELCTHSRNLALFGEGALLLGAYAKVLPLHEILDQARRSDERIGNGAPRSLLDGVPVTMKANIAVGRYWEIPNACSAILDRSDENVIASCNEGGRSASERNIAANGKEMYESDIARRLLKDCGAVLVGITNMDEFGMGSLGTNTGLRRHSNGAQRFEGRGGLSPTYNPLPWMQRLYSLLDFQGSRPATMEESDDFLLRQIRNSTHENPHGISDEGALAGLLEEVRCRVRGNGIEHGDGNKTDPSTPQNFLLSPGGSSSGAAAVTAHGSSLLSVGTDTGGSIRLPAAWTSTVGFKPSYGKLSRYGVVSYASSLDTVGFIAGTAECADIAWRCLRDMRHYDRCEEGSRWEGHLCRDSTASWYQDANAVYGRHQLNSKKEKSSQDQYIKSAKKPLAGVRVGIPSAFSLSELPPPISDAWSWSASYLQNLGGATLVPVPESRVPSKLIKLALASYYVLACAEASSNLSRYDGVRYGMGVDPDEHIDMGPVEDNFSFGPLSDMNAFEEQISATRACGFGDEVQRRILAGTSVLSSDRFHTHYEAAADVRARVARSLRGAFRPEASHVGDGSEGDRVDVMLVPTALSFPPALNPGGCDGARKGEMDPTAVFANDVMTVPISLASLPSVSVPVRGDGHSKCDRSFIGMQIFASGGMEVLVLKVANVLWQ